MQSLIEGGLDNLHIVSDFDLTMSRYHSNSSTPQTTYQILKSQILTSELREEALRQYEYYHAKEIDPNISSEDKHKYLQEWLSLSNQTIVNTKFKSSDLHRIFQSSQLELRSGIDSFFEACENYQVPVEIVSAGIGNLIELAIQSVTSYDKVKILSNFMEFDSGESIIGFKDPLIYSLNKHILLSQENLRSNIILLGDIPSVNDNQDTQMLNSCNYDICLSIGFCNDDTKYDLNDYKEHFDIILVNDSCFSAPEWIVKKIGGMYPDAGLIPNIEVYNRSNL